MQTFARYIYFRTKKNELNIHFQHILINEREKWKKLNKERKTANIMQMNESGNEIRTSINAMW